MSTPSQTSYERALEKLAALLKRKPLTPKAIAAALGCCKPTAYDRVNALKNRGVQVYELKVRESPRGPLSVAYGVRD